MIISVAFKELRMKIALLLILLSSSLFAQERFSTPAVKDTSGYVWSLTVTADDTTYSKVFDANWYQSLQAHIALVSGTTIDIDIELWASNFYDIGFTKTQSVCTLVDTGWADLRSFYGPSTRFRRLMFVGGSSTDTVTVTGVTNGWSNQREASSNMQ